MPITCPCSSPAAIFVQRRPRLVTVSARHNPKHLLYLVPRDSRLYKASDNIMCHLAHLVRRVCANTEWWMNIGAISIRPDIKLRDRSVILKALPRRSGQGALFLKPEALKSTADLLLTHAFHQQLTWFVKISWHTTPDICWTLWSGIL